MYLNSLSAMKQLYLSIPYWQPIITKFFAMDNWKLSGENTGFIVDAGCT
jgi:hypothetical protein